MTENDLGEIIKDARINKGLSQRDLAKAIGVTNPSISSWENGNTKNISFVHMLKLSRLLDIDLAKINKDFADLFNRQCSMYDRLHAAVQGNSFLTEFYENDNKFFIVKYSKEREKDFQHVRYTARMCDSDYYIRLHPDIVKVIKDSIDDALEKVSDKNEKG